MSDLEKSRAQRESLDAATSAVPSSRRSDIWSGLMRYLSGEVVRERKRSDRAAEESSNPTTPPAESE
jgi:hypothetical protein